MTPRILLTGATGYIGGTILHRLVTEQSPPIREASITVLVRGSEERIQKLKQVYGDRIACIQFDGWNQSALLSDVASKHDIVINAGSGFHPPSAEALVRGLARNKERDSPAWMLHTAGSSNISDLPLTGTPRPDAEYHDAEAEAVYNFEKSLEISQGPYPQRTSELLTIDIGIELGVRVLSVQAPLIFGTGEGLFQNAGLVIPILMSYALVRGYGFQLGDGTAVIDYVHVADLADWYVLCVKHIITDGGKSLPSGKQGIVFPEAGRVKIYDIAKDCVETAFRKKALPKREGDPRQPEVRTVDIAEAATTTAGNQTVAEAGWGGHRRTKGTVARKLGWNPIHGHESWKKDLEDELDFALQGKRPITIGNCIAEKDQ